ncbi:MAG: hypothetical protein IT462_12845 [Planctomycetes bacterium]|nr:hypothetical protein [Planctomycetota bacterium]
MAIEYHKLLDRLLVRRAAETESLQKQVEANQPGPKFILAFFCFGIAVLAFVAVPMLFPFWILPGVGGVILVYNGLSVWRQVRTAARSVHEEIGEEEYRRYLLAKLGAKKFDQLVAAVGAGGSDSSIKGWLKPLDFDDHDVEYLLWLAEALLESMGGSPMVAVRKAEAEKTARKAGTPGSVSTDETPAKSDGMSPTPADEAAEITPPVVPVAELAERAASEPVLAPVTQTEQKTPVADATGSGSPRSALSEEEVAKFKALAAQRKAEYEKWRQAGGRETDPDDPLGKLKDFSPEKIAELKRKAQERRKQGVAPASSAPAPGAATRENAFSQGEMAELEKKALSRFEPRPQDAPPAKEQILGAVFNADEMAELKKKAERATKEKERSTPKASENDPEWDDTGERKADSR